MCSMYNLPAPPGAECATQSQRYVRDRFFYPGRVLAVPQGHCSPTLSYHPLTIDFPPPSLFLVF